MTGAAFSAATLGFALFTLGRYFGPALGEGLLGVALLALAAGAATAAGRRLLRRAGPEGLDEAGLSVAGATLGLGLLSLGLFALTAAGALTPAGAGLLLAALAAYGAPEWKALGRGWGGLASTPAIVWLALGTMALLAFAPPHQYDSLVYHLPLPAAYAASGGFVELRHLLYSHFPQNAEMLFALSLLWDCDVLAQLFMAWASVLSVFWVLWALRARPRLAGLAAFLLATHTAFLLLGSTSYTEPLVMLWVTGSAVCFLEWERDQKARRWLILSGALAGLALGAKYYAGISAACLGTLLLTRRRWKEFLVFSAAAWAVFAPWLIKNALLVGNPVFPFFYKWFPMTGTGWTAETAAGYFAILTEYGHREGILKDLVALPSLLLRNSLRFGGGMDVLGDLGWDLLIWCVPLMAWAGRRERSDRLLLAYVGLYFAGWFSTGVVLRFLVVIAPLLAILAAAGLAALWDRLGLWGRRALACAVLVLTAAHLLLAAFVHGVFGTGRVVLGLETREEFLASRLDYYPCARAAGRRGGNDKLLIVGDQRSYFSGFPTVATTVHGPNPWVEWANASESPRALHEKLRAEGFGRLLLVPAEFQRLAPAIGSFTERGAANWAGLENSLKPSFQGPRCVLLEL